MKKRYRLFRRQGTFYLQDSTTGQQKSLRTKSREDAERLLHAQNEAHVQPAFNLQIAQAYLLAADPVIRTRSWTHVMDEVARTKTGETRLRWERAMREAPFDLLRNRCVIETRAEHFLDVFACGTVSTNIFLRRLHNFALDMNWLAAAVIPRKQWPGIRFREKRAITREEHLRILEGERNPEWRSYYELLWH